MTECLAACLLTGTFAIPVIFNDFPHYAKIDNEVECIVYADDATLTIRGKSLEEVLGKADRVMERVRVWCVSNKLSLNEEKTIKMTFSLRGMDFDNPRYAKFLGICVSPPALSFEEHANNIGSKISRNVFVLRQLASTVTTEVLRSAYYALIHSRVCYCILTWGGSSAAVYLFRLQRRAVRVLGGVGYTEDCRSTFINHNILTLPSEYILASISTLRKYLQMHFLYKR